MYIILYNEDIMSTVIDPVRGNAHSGPVIGNFCSLVISNLLYNLALYSILGYSCLHFFLTHII